ncbi:MAG: 4Fe-4S binding protein, partial [Bacteroidota bacterium]
MNAMLTSLAIMLGRAPRLPATGEMTPAARRLLEDKQSPEGKAARLQHLKRDRITGRHTWRNRRWITLIAVNLLFVLSYRFDVQLIEGALTASRVIGFHFADLNSALQVMLAFKTVLISLVIGTSTVLIMWWLLGGRTFCSWVCPYHLLAELAEKLHLKLAAKGVVKEHPIHRGTRTVLYGVFAALALLSGYTAFEFISPVGIVSRALVYGGTIALA